MDMRHEPTADWIVGKKITNQEAETFELVHGVHQKRRSPPHDYAEVVAVGPGRQHPQTGHIPKLPCAVGDVIMVRSVAGDPESIEGVEYHWFIPDEVLAVVPTAPRLVAS